VRKAAVALFALVVAVVVVWLVQGRHTVTLTQRMEKQNLIDEFGDTIEKVTWRPTFEIGLIDFVAPCAGALGAGVVLLWLARRKAKRKAE